MAPEKAPAFQFYPKEFLTDGNVAGMSLQERGALFTDICEAVASRNREAPCLNQRFIGRFYWREHPSRPFIPMAIKRAVFVRDGGRCQVCASIEKLEYDHVIPFCKGGEDSFENLRLLCKRCNRRKAASVGR